MDTTIETKPRQAELKLVSCNGQKLVIVLTGDWEIANRLPSADVVKKQLTAGVRVERVGFNTSELTNWDSGLLTFLINIKEFCSQNKIQMEPEGIPEGARRLLKLASAVPDRKGARKEFKREFFLSLLGGRAIDFFRSASEMIAFIGEATIAFAKFLIGKATFRRSDLLLLLQECGAQALPVVSLISILLGLILGFVGAIQLKMFGAQLFVADVVAI